MDPALYQAHAELEDTHWWFVGRRAIVREVLRRHVGAASRILDLGCGTGGMLPMLTELGSVTGIEPEPFAVAHARQARRLDVVEGQVPEDVPKDGQYDLVTAFDVVEHIADEHAALQALRMAVSPGGFVVVTVPAVPWLWSEHDVANGHHRRYTRRSLLSALQVGGLEVLHLSYFNTVLFPVVAAVRLASKLRRARVEGRTDFEVSVGPLNGLLRRVFSAERRLAASHGLPLGVSLIAVARRPA